MSSLINKFFRLINQDGPTSTTFWLVAEKGFRMLIGVAFNLLFFKALGPTYSGDYVSALSLSFIFFPLFTLGLNDILIYQFSHTERPGAIFGTSLLMKFTSGALVILSFFVFFLFYGTPNHFYLFFGLLSQLLMFWLQGLESLDYYFQQKGNVRHLIQIKIIGLILFGIFKIALITKGGSPNDFWILMAIPLEVLFVYSLFWAINPAAKTLIRTSSISKKEISLLIQQAKVQLPSAFMINTFMRIDVLLIRWWLGNETLAGIYGAAIRFSEPWLMIPLILSNSFSGKYFSLKQKDPEQAENYWKGVSGIILLVALFIIGFTWALAPLLQLYYGQSFAGLSSVMSVHIFIVLCSAAGSFGWPWLVAHNQHWQIFWRNLIGLIVMAGLSYLLWPLAGIVGIAIALVVSYAINHIVFNIMVKACYPLLKMQLEAYQQLKISSIKATLKP